MDGKGISNPKYPIPPFTSDDERSKGCKSSPKRNGRYLPSGKLTWLAGKWTMNESMFFLKKMGDICHYHVSLPECTQKNSK